MNSKTNGYEEALICVLWFDQSLEIVTTHVFTFQPAETGGVRSERFDPSRRRSDYIAEAIFENQSTLEFFSTGPADGPRPLCVNDTLLTAKKSGPR